MIALGTAFTAAVRMVDRVHRYTTYVRALAEPSAAAGLTDRNIFVLEVADLTNRRPAFGEHHALLARRQLEQRNLPFLGHQLRLGARTSHQLRSGSGLHLNRMDHGTERDILQRQRVAALDIRLRAAFHLVTRPDPLVRDDIAF